MTASEESEGLEVDYTGGYDEEAEQYQIALSVPGLTVAVVVSPDGFDALGPVLSALPTAVEELIEQIAEAREAAVEQEETP